MPLRRQPAVVAALRWCWAVLVVAARWCWAIVQRYVAVEVERMKAREAIRAAITRSSWRIGDGREVMAVGILNGWTSLLIPGRAVPLGDVTRIEVTAGMPQQDYRRRRRSARRSAVVGGLVAGHGHRTAGMAMGGALGRMGSEAHARTVVVASLADGSVISIVVRGEAAIHRAHLTRAVGGQVPVVG